MAVPDIAYISREFLEVLLDNPHESQILVDKDDIVRFLSSHSEEMYGHFFSPVSMMTTVGSG